MNRSFFVAAKVITVLSMIVAATPAIAGDGVEYRTRDEIMLDGDRAIGRVGELKYSVETLTPDHLIVRGADGYMTWMFFGDSDKSAIKKLRANGSYKFKFRVKRISGSDLFLDFLSANGVGGESQGTQSQVREDS